MPSARPQRGEAGIPRARMGRHRRAPGKGAGEALVPRVKGCIQPGDARVPCECVRGVLGDMLVPDDKACRQRGERRIPRVTGQNDGGDALLPAVFERARAADARFCARGACAQAGDALVPQVHTLACSREQLSRRR